MNAWKGCGEDPNVLHLPFISAANKHNIRIRRNILRFHSVLNDKSQGTTESRDTRGMLEPHA